MEFKGLSSGQASALREKNRKNGGAKTYTRSYTRIFADNIFSYFNIIMTAFFVLLVITGNYKNTLFIGVVISNLFMGILQECKMKREVDRLSVLKQGFAEVLRDGKRCRIADSNIVCGDIVFLKAGDSIAVDGEILQTDGIELDEAMLTGESDAVLKTESEPVFSGSFVVSGSAVIKVTAVGSDSFAGKISDSAKKSRKVYSPLTVSIEKIIRFMSFIILPISVVLFCSQYFLKNDGFNTALVSTAGAAIGMIPSGLVLLTTVTMALGVLRSAKSGALISQQKAVETLARVDTFCIDKTGTVTTGNISLENIVVADGSFSETEAKKLLFSVINCFEEKNATAKAVDRYFKTDASAAVTYKAVQKISFSSKRKYCAAELETAGFFAFGAPELLAEKSPQSKALFQDGMRVLALVKYPQNSVDKQNGRIIAYALFKDEIRPDAEEIIKNFRKNGVDIKIISGDGCSSVKSIAEKVGFSENTKTLDMSLVKDFSDSQLEKAAEGVEIFGRCDPQQKCRLVQIFQKQGRIVAMTGDGVNDVPAMRQAHCAVAMSAGADAAKGVADVVLKDSFAPMMQVISEGRRVINNMSRVAVLYLVKTLFSLLLSVYFVFSSGSYPLKPVHLTLIGSVFTGIPSFFMAIEKNYRPIKKGFVKSVMAGAVPGGFGIAVSVIILSILRQKGMLAPSDFSSLCVWITGAVSGMVLAISSIPLNFYRSAVAAVMTAMYIGAMTVLKPFIEISKLSPHGVFVLWTVLIINAAFIFACDMIKKKVISKKYEKS